MQEFGDVKANLLNPTIPISRYNSHLSTLLMSKVGAKLCQERQSLHFGRLKLWVWGGCGRKSLASEEGILIHKSRSSLSWVIPTKNSFLLQLNESRLGTVSQYNMYQTHYPCDTQAKINSYCEKLQGSAAHELPDSNIPLMRKAKNLR